MLDSGKGQPPPPWRIAAQRTPLTFGCNHVWQLNAQLCQACFDLDHCPVAIAVVPVGGRVEGCGCGFCALAFSTGMTGYATSSRPPCSLARELVSVRVRVSAERTRRSEQERRDSLLAIKETFRPRHVKATQKRKEGATKYAVNCLSVFLSFFLSTHPLFAFLFNPISFPSSLPSLPPSLPTPYPAYNSSTIFPTVAGGNLKY